MPVRVRSRRSAMAKHGAMYPQVEPGAAAMANGRLVRCAASLSVDEALVRAERARAEVVVPRRGCAVRREELRQARAWGLGACRAAAVAWHDVPSIDAR